MCFLGEISKCTLSLVVKDNGPFTYQSTKRIRCCVLIYVNLNLGGEPIGFWSSRLKGGWEIRSSITWLMGALLFPPLKIPSAGFPSSQQSPGFHSLGNHSVRGVSCPLLGAFGSSKYLTGKALIIPSPSGDGEKRNKAVLWRIGCMQDRFPSQLMPA